MSQPSNVYGDGRTWDSTQIKTVNEILNQLRDDLDVNNLNRLRCDTLWLMDVLFPSGFTYIVNRSSSEPVHGGYMEGNKHA